MNLNNVSDDLSRLLTAAGAMAAERGGTLDPIDLVQAIIDESGTTAEEVLVEAAIDMPTLQAATDTIRLAHS